MKLFIRFLILAGVICAAIFAEDFIARGVGVVICIATIIIGYMIGGHTEKRETYGVFLFSSGYILAMFFFLLTLLVEVHVEDNGNNVKVYSRFWTHILAEGKKLEKNTLVMDIALNMVIYKGLKKIVLISSTRIEIHV